MSKALRVADYLGHIVEAIERIDRYVAEVDEVAFLSSELVQDAVIRNLEIIGEAANNILRVAPDFASQHDEIPWQVMYAMRNRLSHGYHQVDMEMVWKTVERDLSALHALIQGVIANQSF